MASGEKTGGVEHPDDNFKETIELTLPISADEILKLTYDNTSVYSSRENPAIDCIEIILPSPAGSAARVHRIFERLDLMSGLVSLGFRTVTDRYATTERCAAHAAWAASEIEEEWAVIARDGVSVNSDELEKIDYIAHDTPVVELQLDDGEIHRATYGNTHLFYVVGGDQMIASYLGLSQKNEETGALNTRYVFDVLAIMEDLEAQGFPVTKLPFPSNAVVAAYTRRFSANIDKTLEHIRGGDEATPA